jgi:glutathione S-transferase
MFDPPSRRVRLTMAEKNISFESISEKPWEPRAEYLALNPAGEVPTLVIKSIGAQLILSDATAICEYLEETQPGPTLLGKDPEQHAEVRRLVNWFEIKTYNEVTALLVGEKAMKRLRGTGEPDSLLIRTGCHNVHGHLDYIGWLTERRNWLAGDDITLADFAAAAQLSAIDYLGDVPWEQHPEAKSWYARIKSRPCFRPLLGDHVAGFLPPRHYADLDF